MIKKESIVVPIGVRYIGRDWKEFKLPDDKAHILNKVMTGCGFTEWVLQSNEDIILCSPRKMLLENKWEQHKEDVFLVVSDFDPDPEYDKNLNNNKEKVIEVPDYDDEKKKEALEKLKVDLNSYIDLRYSQFKPIKILVTYDSYGVILDILYQRNEEHFRGVWTIIDEFQSILVDSRFKSETENRFLTSLRKIGKACYVSATPMLDEYLEEIDELKDLPYYEFDWTKEEPTRVMRPNLKPRICRNIYEPAKSIIKTYLDGKYETAFRKEGGQIVKHESKELVIFLNSVNNIINIIKKNSLKPEQVNILCAKTPQNKKRLQEKLGIDYEIGRIPLEGEPHKMFTFCTRTVYLGADFYSTNARTVILSDANLENLAVDIILDLPQILGRQRNKENPWKYSAELYYIPLSRKNENKSYEEVLKEKYEMTETLLRVYNKPEISPTEKEALKKNYRIAQENTNYKHHYVSFDYDTGDPVFNKLVMLAEKRAFDIEQTELASRFSLFAELDRRVGLTGEARKIKEFLADYDKLPGLIEKLKFIVKTYDEGNLTEGIKNQLNEKHFKEYLEVLGIERIKVCRYNPSLLNEELMKAWGIDSKKLREDIYKKFIVGEVYSRKKAKEMLIEVYRENGLENEKPSAVDLAEWFDIDLFQIKKKGKKINSVRIRSHKKIA